MDRVQRATVGTVDERQELVRQIFGPGVGLVLEEYSCAVEKNILLHGRMYLTRSHILHYSNIFGFVSCVKIPLSKVKVISKEMTALFIPNAISVITKKKGYIFRSFWDRDAALKKLVQQQALIMERRASSSSVLTEGDAGERERSLAPWEPTTDRTSVG